MDIELKQKWLEALRSGEYKQTQHRLKNQNGHCCLGVLCEVYGDAKHFIDPITGLGTEDYINFVEAKGLKKLFSEKAQQQGLFDKTIEYHLAYMNDNGKSFSEIADWIEENVK